MDNDDQARVNAATDADRSAAVAGAIRTLAPDKPGLTALDYGCGDGAVGLLLVDRFSRLILADTSPDAVAAAERAAAGVANVQVRALDLVRQVPDDMRVDVVFSAMSWHHIHDLEALADAIRVVAPGGWLFVADLDEDGGAAHAHYPDFDGHNGFDRTALASMLASRGFEHVTTGDLWQGARWINDELVTSSVFLLSARVPRGGGPLRARPR